MEGGVAELGQRLIYLHVWCQRWGGLSFLTAWQPWLVGLLWRVYSEEGGAGHMAV